MAKINEKHYLDDEGNPAGGETSTIGILITWQNGPLGTPDDPNRKKQNGAFVEDVIKAAIGRLEFYQETKFNCEENRMALLHLEEALEILKLRTRRRIKRGVEGTNVI